MHIYAYFTHTGCCIFVHIPGIFVHACANFNFQNYAYFLHILYFIFVCVCVRARVCVILIYIIHTRFWKPQL